MNATQSLPQADLRMRRIQKVSKILRAILLVCMIAQVAVIVLGALQFALLHHLSDWKYQFGPPNWRFNLAFTNVSNSDFVVLPFGFMVTLNFFRLFCRLKDGHLFEGQTIEYLEKAAKWWIALGIAKIIYQFLEPIIFSRHNINIQLNVNNGGDAILAGLLVFFIAWVLREGQKLKDEQEFTV
ncbi:MAG TPA: hypothetical protein VME24_01845 [Alphaproteobacteria bacterium]|nr:hypothetical protein [Alphaproteobacteria bacterium]